MASQLTPTTSPNGSSRKDAARNLTPSSPMIKLHDVLGRTAALPLPAEVTGRLPSNLVETWAAYHLQLLLAGADLASLDLQVVARNVTVRGRYRIPEIEAGSDLRREVASTPFCYIFEIPGQVDGDKAKARYERGILTIELPKVVHLKPSSIPVEVVP